VSVTFHIIQWRFTPASYPLFISAMVVAIVLIFSRETPAPTRTPLMPASHIGWRSALVLPVVLGVLGIHFASWTTDGVFTRYADFNQHYPKPTRFYHWLNQNVRDTTIYSINAPPLLLYGSDFSNRVIYTTATHSGYYGDQAYRWGEIQQLVEDRQIDYIVVSFNYPELLQAGLIPSPEVLAEIDQMRANLRTVFEDEHVTLFATQYAENVPAPP
jgi:hypothetical protein